MTRCWSSTSPAGCRSACRRSPTDGEVAQQLGITTDELHQIFNQISFVSVVALDELLSVGSERGDRLSLVHYEGLTLAEIGQVPGVTESRVCQMHTKALLQLRAKMQDAR